MTASVDLREFQAANPGRIKYDASAKCFRRARAVLANL